MLFEIQSFSSLVRAFNLRLGLIPSCVCFVELGLLDCQFFFNHSDLLDLDQHLTRVWRTATLESTRRVVDIAFESDALHPDTVGKRHGFGGGGIGTDKGAAEHELHGSRHFIGIAD